MCLGLCPLMYWGFAPLRLLQRHNSPKVFLPRKSKGLGGYGLGCEGERE